MSISTLYALLGVCLIQFLAPSCGGSGIPENKAFLNGAQMPGLFRALSFYKEILIIIKL